MYVTIRSYDGHGLADALVANESVVKEIIGNVDGVEAYYLVRTDDGTVSVTVCDSQASAEETNRAAASWVRENLGDSPGGAVQISGGEVVLDL
jgi:hypothetical protein